MKINIKAVLNYLAMLIIGLILGCLVRCDSESGKVVPADTINALDSVKTASMEARIKELDDQLVRVNHRADSLDKAKSKVIVKYNTIKETITESTDVCDSVIAAADTVITTLENANDALRDEVVLLEEKVIATDSIVAIKNITIGELNNNIVDLNKQLKKKSNWWNRNKFWIGVGSAIIVGGVVYGVAATR